MSRSLVLAHWGHLLALICMKITLACPWTSHSQASMLGPHHVQYDVTSHVGCQVPAVWEEAKHQELLWPVLFVHTEFICMPKTGPAVKQNCYHTCLQRAFCPLALQGMWNLSCGFWPMEISLAEPSSSCRKQHSEILVQQEFLLLETITLECKPSHQEHSATAPVFWH